MKLYMLVNLFTKKYNLSTYIVCAKLCDGVSPCMLVEVSVSPLFAPSSFVTLLKIFKHDIVIYTTENISTQYSNFHLKTC